MSSELRPRLRAVRSRLEAEGLDALLVTQAANRRYLSGFRGSAGILLVGRERALLYADFRYWEQAAREAPEWELARQKAHPQEELGPLLRQVLEARRVGFEAQALSVEAHRQWSEAVPEVEWVPTSGWVEDLRAVKDGAELARIRQAAELADRAMELAGRLLRPGRTEAEVAWELETHLRTHGAEELSFPVIVASGPNAALPHHRAGGRVLERGDAVVVDLGAPVEGYHSDLTRTYLLGQPQGRFQEVHEIVRRAQQACLEGARAGVSGREADGLARRVIEEAGQGEAFGHGTGHGVGLEVHERPRASRLSKDTLQAGNTLTVEPGIYLPGWGGVRIEDLAVVGEQGMEVLSAAPRDPQVG